MLRSELDAGGPAARFCEHIQELLGHGDGKTTMIGNNETQPNQSLAATRRKTEPA